MNRYLKKIITEAGALLLGEPRLLIVERRLEPSRRYCDRLAAIEATDAQWRRDNLRYFGREITVREGR